MENKIHEELEHLVRALSHDMSANFMLLNGTFTRLKNSLTRFGRSEQCRPDQAHGQIDSQVAEVEACLRESERFLEDLLQLARTGTVDMKPDRVKLDEVVEEILLEQRNLIRQHNVEVRVHQPLPKVFCNRSRLKQVVTNLLRNAILHGGGLQHPRIIISSLDPQPNEDHGALEGIAVNDNGPGIPPHMQQEIFLPGRRLGTAADGSGMGLAIVKKIVDYYGGRIYVDSRGQEGTTMVVRLPSGEKNWTQKQRSLMQRTKNGRRWKVEPQGHREEPLASHHDPHPVHRHTPQ